MASNKNEDTGVIMKIQKQSGCLLIVIGAAMLAFVLTDLLKSGPSVFSGSQNVVGEIAGDKITYEEYSEKVQSLKTFYQEDLGGSGDEEQFQEMAWNQMIQEKIIKEEHEKLGIRVGAEEFKDLTTGLHPDQSIIQAFQDQETKQFNRNQLIQFLEVQMQEDERKYRIWYNYYEVPLRERIEGSKYDRLVKNGVFVTKLEAKDQYDKESKEMSAKVVGLSYDLIEDSTFQYTDSDLKAYIKSNSKKYKQDASRDIQFVVMNVFPSAKDSMDTKKWAEGLVDKFKAAKKDSVFVAVQRSSTPFDAEYKGRGSFPPSVEDQLFNSDSGTVIGPVFDDGAYSLYKVSGIKFDTTYAMKARHVLLPLNKIEGDGLTEGRKLMAEIRSGAKDFAEEASDNYDGTGASKGDMGWIKQDGYSEIPSDLRDELFTHSQGDWFVFQSTRGVHIVNVTEGKTNKTIQVAVLSRSIRPGSAADQVVARKAADIQYKAQDSDDFQAVVTEEGQIVREATKIRVDNPQVAGISDPKEIIRWLYNEETEVGDVSDIIDMQDRYVVAKCVAIREEGTADLDDMREVIVADYIREQKGKKMTEQIKDALAETEDPEQLAKKLNSVVQVVPTVNMMSPQVTGVGSEADVQGAIFGLPQGKHSDPIVGTTGVFVVWNTGEVKSDQREYNEEDLMNFLNSQTEQLVDAGVLDALKAKGEITDNRYRFY